jgi:hypothetical protein
MPDLSILASWKTSIIGFVGGAALYLFSTGAKLPENKQEWFTFGVAVTVAGLGLAAKDGDRGVAK